MQVTFSKVNPEEDRDDDPQHHEGHVTLDEMDMANADVLDSIRREPVAVMDDGDPPVENVMALAAHYLGHIDSEEAECYAGALEHYRKTIDWDQWREYTAAVAGAAPPVNRDDLVDWLRGQFRLQQEIADAPGAVHTDYSRGFAEGMHEALAYLSQWVDDDEARMIDHCDPCYHMGMLSAVVAVRDDGAGRDYTALCALHTSDPLTVGPDEGLRILS